MDTIQFIGGGDHMVALALYVPNLIWFGCIARLSHPQYGTLPVWGERREEERRWVDRSAPPGRSVRGGPAGNTPPGSPEHKTTQLSWCSNPNLSGFAILTGISVNNWLPWSEFLLLYQGFQNFRKKNDYFKILWFTSVIYLTKYIFEPQKCSGRIRIRPDMQLICLPGP